MYDYYRNSTESLHTLKWPRCIRSEANKNEQILALAVVHSSGEY